MPEKGEYSLEELAEDFKREAIEYIESELFSGTGEEEATERARETVRAFLFYCIDQAVKYAKTPEDLKKETIECLNELHSTGVIIANRILRDLIRKKGK